MSETPDQKVEDVLSSVRRLVSNEVPRKPRTEVPTGPGALVLTKDHMVPTDRSPQSATRSLEDRIAELEEAVGGQDGEFEPDGSEDQAQHRPDRIVISRPPVVEGQPTRVRSRRLSKISMVETGPANGEAASESGDEASSDGSDLAEFRRESHIVTKPTPNASDLPSDDVQKSVSNQDRNDPSVEAPMAEDVPTVARTSAEVTAFSDPDDVVRTFEARIEAGRPISDPSPLHPADPDIDAKLASKKPTNDEANANKEEADEVQEDFDTALSNAVAASLGGLDQVGAEDAAHEDYLNTEEFDGTDDPELTAAQMLSGLDSNDFDEKPSPSEPLVLGEPQIAQSENDTFEAETLDQVETTETTDATSRTTDSEADAAEPAETPSDDSLKDDGASNEAENDKTGESPDGALDQVAAALADTPDEEAMRLLIARMIRAELQGDLGEQITRNVRKLVRREIKRALSADDLT